jgi:hypothetical protein
MWLSELFTPIQIHSNRLGEYPLQRNVHGRGDFATHREDVGMRHGILFRLETQRG